MLKGEPADNLQGIAWKINDTNFFLALRLIQRKHQTMVRLINVIGFGSDQLLRPGSRKPRQVQQIFVLGLLRRRQQCLERLRRDRILPMFSGRDFKLSDRAAIQIALLRSPIQTPLDGPEIVSSRGLRQRVTIDPNLDVMRSQLGGLHVRVLLGEPLQAVAKPAVGSGRTIPLYPMQKLINDGDERIGVDGLSFLLRRGEQLFVALKRLCLVWSEVVLLTVEGDPSVP